VFASHLGSESAPFPVSADTKVTLEKQGLHEAIYHMKVLGEQPDPYRLCKGSARITGAARPLVRASINATTDNSRRRKSTSGYGPGHGWVCVSSPIIEHSIGLRLLSGSGASAAGGS
jgi:hypothetical protein